MCEPALPASDAAPAVTERAGVCRSSSDSLDPDLRLLVAVIQLLFQPLTHTRSIEPDTAMQTFGRAWYKQEPQARAGVVSPSRPVQLLLP